MLTLILSAPTTTWRFSTRIATALWLWSERRALERLDAHLLMDIGVTPAEAHEEAARPFWDVPPNRR